MLRSEGPKGPPALQRGRRLSANPAQAEADGGRLPGAPRQTGEPLHCCTAETGVPLRGIVEAHDRGLVKASGMRLTIDASVEDVRDNLNALELEN